MLLIGSVALLLIGIIAERIVFVTYCPLRGVLFNLGYLVPAILLQLILTAAIGGSVVMVTNMAGGGLVRLPSTGWLLIPAIAVFTVVMDFSEFLFHRMQHLIPALWSMHSFHHSDEALNISTTYRHFWAEQAIKSVTIYLLVGLLFRASPLVLTAYGTVSLYNLFSHMNLPIGFGRWWFLLNSPQYHRIHHSSLVEHQDRNFAALFPIFDAIGNSAHRSGAGEFPPTGLYDRDKPKDMLEAVFWPARGIYRRLRSGPIQAHISAPEN
jgi:sterol desaturase/sphingolipid hydroxylase (fatty acid hydroxylase superfamily)